MIKDLIQGKYSYTSGFTQLRSPQHQRNASTDLKSVISSVGDPRKNSDKLKFLLLKIRYPQQYNQEDALDGHPTQFMKIINYSLFVSSQSAKKYLFEKGVDPDTVYLNDYKFMQRVFSILFKIFGYRPTITLEQFFKYGFSEQKMILCCDTINLVKRLSKDIKVKRNLSRKRSETSRSLSVGRFVVHNHKNESQQEYQYQRDTVNKVATISTLNGKLQDKGQENRSMMQSTIENARMRSTSSDQFRSITNGQSSKYSKTKSRYLLSNDKSATQNCHHGAHVEKVPVYEASTANNKSVHSSAKKTETEFQPLRANRAIKSQIEKRQEPEIVSQAVSAKSYETPQFQQNENLISMLKQTIDTLNNKFDQFQVNVNRKIEAIHHDYHNLSQKFETHQSVANRQSIQPDVNYDYFSQKVNSPFNQSEQPNPLKEFTLGSGQVPAQMHAAALSQENFASKSTRDEFRDESRQMIENIRKNLDESKQILNKYHTTGDVLSNQNK